jgi:hypothetical protein
MKKYVIKFKDESMEDAIHSGIFSTRREVDKEARHLVIEGYAVGSFEILEVEDLESTI